jgi:uncharacterized membrane protein
VLVAGEAFAWSLGHPALPAIEALTGPWCHHDPTRTLSVAGTLLPVCARCTGLYGGLVLGPLIGAALPYRGRALAWVAGLAMAPVVVGLLAALAEAVGAVSTGNTTRLFLGLMLTLGPAALGIVGSRVLAHALAGAATPP